MDDFLKYFEDNRFVEWVFHPNDELNHYWEGYLRNHPDEKKQVEFSRLILAGLRSRKEETDQCEPAELFSGMLMKMQKSDRTSFASRFLWPLFKYAAVALIFLSIGILQVYQPEKDKFKAFNEPIGGVANDIEARLILSDGKNITLPDKESCVEYEKNGKIVINRHDTIESLKPDARSEMNQLIIPFGKNSSIKLPDGTVAYLNAGSRLMYPSAFMGKVREVFLIGEGYFEVAHNPDVSFIVKTNDISIVAVGTRFNISAYPADKIIETVLVEGKVILRENSFKMFRKEMELKPGELAAFNRESLETSAQPVDIANYVAWHEGYLNFQSTDLNRIVLRLERYYNIKIYLDDPLLGMRRITGKLALREEKEKVLEVLATTSQAGLFKINESTFGLK